jgi:hypothetical protein
MSKKNNKNNDNYMKKLKYLLANVLLFLPFLAAKAQIDPGVLKTNADTFSAGAGFTNIGIGAIIANIIAIALGLLALLFLTLTITAGFKWMNAGGNEEDVKKAQTSLKNAVIGLVVVLAAYTITYFIFNKLPFSGGASLMPNPV